MKSKLLISLLVLSSLTMAKNYEINTYFNIGYDVDRISKKEFKDAGLSELVSEEYKVNKENQSLGIDATYVINTPKGKVKVGGGASLNLDLKLGYKEFKHNSESKLGKIDILKKEVSELEEEYKELEEAYKDANYSRIVANNIYEETRQDLKNLTREMGKNEAYLERYQELIAEYDTPEKISELNQKHETLGDKVEEYKANRDKYQAEKEKARMEYMLAKTEDERMNARVKYTQAHHKLQDEQRKLDNVFRERAEIFEKLEYLLGDHAKRAEDKKARNKAIELEQEKIYDAMPEYREAKKLINEARNEARTKMTEKEEELEAKREVYENATQELTYEDYENDLSLRTLEKVINEKVSLGASLYGKVEYSYTINEVELLTSMQLGIKLSDNKLYKGATVLQDKEAKINGNTYYRPENLKPIKISPLFSASFGVVYKGFRTEVYTGYGKSLIGLSVGCQY